LLRPAQPADVSADSHFQWLWLAEAFEYGRSGNAPRGPHRVWTTPT
jgi:hypothetical protein